MSQLRYSIANLACIARKDGTNEKVQFGILNPSKLKEGKRQYMALGGGAMLKEAGKKMLEERFRATGFELDEHTGYFDARFQADETHLEEIFAIFSKYQPEFEYSTGLDILDELSGKEFAGTPDPLLSTGDLAFATVYPLFSTRQAPAEGSDTSGRSLASMPTRRLFRIHALMLKPAGYRRFLASPMVRVLSPAELETTHGGATAGVTNDGIPIQNNLFLY